MLREIIPFFFHVIKKPWCQFYHCVRVSVGKLQLHFFSRLITRKHSILVCCLRPLSLYYFCYHQNRAVVLLVTRNGIAYAGEMLIRFFRFVISRISLSPVELSGLIWIFGGGSVVSLYYLSLATFVALRDLSTVDIIPRS